MSDSKIIRVFDLVEEGICVSADDGQLVHNQVADLLRKKCLTTVSFEGVTILISSFLNAAIGQLYGEFSEEDINKYLLVDALMPEDEELLRRVIDNAKTYFEDKAAFDEASNTEDKDE